MKRIIPILFTTLLLLAGSCTSQKKIAYLNNLPEPGGEESFNMDIPDYKIQPRDVLYITVKAMAPDGSIRDFLTGGNTGINLSQGESGGALYGFNVDPDGNLSIPGIGKIKASGLTLEEIRESVQELAVRVFKNATVECKLLSFKFTVIGEVRSPGMYINYNNYLTVLEAIGRAGGVGDYGNKSRILVIRPIDKGTKTYRLNINDKKILTSEAYFLLPNDVVIVEPVKQKIFNINLPTISFIISTFTAALTLTLLTINYLGK
jgi:polysaccharide export outer membrane protein